MRNNLLIVYDKLPENLSDYNLVVHYNFDDGTIKLYNKGSLIMNINGANTITDVTTNNDEYGGTDNYGKDEYELDLEYTVNSVNYDSIYVDNINIQEYAGDNNWCKCEIVDINGNRMLKYTALSNNNTQNIRTAYFYHTTTDSILSSGPNVGKKVSKKWCVTVIQNINPTIQIDIPTPIVSEDKLTIFNELINSFNLILYDNPSRYINNDNKNITYQYLLSLFNIADDEWNKPINNSLFNKDLYFEPVDYRSSDTEGDLNTYKAMQAWLIAMCLAELVPTSGLSTNNQTELFKCAFQFGNNNLYKIGSTDSNANIIQANCYGIKQDAMIARYVASIIYANNHDRNINIINTCRQEMNSSCISINSFNLDTNPSDLSCSSYGYTFKSKTIIGYFINGDDIFGAPAGPFTTSDGYNPTNRKPNNQSADLFYEAGNVNDWYDYNYKMDVAIDKYVREHYNFYCDDNNTNSDRTQANIDAFNNQPKEIRQIVLDAGIVPSCQDFMWHGKKRMKFTGVNRFPIHFKPNNNVDYIYMHKFELADDTTTNGDNIYEYVGPYYIESLPKLWYSNPQASNKLNLNTASIQGEQTHEMKFLCRIRSIADDNRNFSYANEYGRRRPLGGIQAGWTRNEQKQDSPLNGINKFYAAALCVDELEKYQNIQKVYKTKTDDGETMYADDFPHDRPASWPSGHASQTWTPALYLCQMIADNPALQNQKLEILKQSYRLGSLRSVGRFHWNSDILYGRLYATMLLPILNATKNLRNEYNRVKAKLCNNQQIPELKSFGNIGGDTIGNTQEVSDSLSFTLRIYNNSGSVVKLNGEFYMFLDTIEDGKLTSDNTGKYGYNGNGLILEGGTSAVSNSISINNGGYKDFNITIPSEILNRLSNNLSPQSRCYGHQGNIILYTYGRWPNTNMPDGWQSGHISDFYKHGFIDNNTNGIKLTNGSMHALEITGIKATTCQIL